MQTQEQEKLSSSTLKRNPKMDLSSTDLLKLLSHLEGELQARDVAIAVLKSEKVKQMLVQNRFRSPAAQSEPMAALQRDSTQVKDSRVDETQIRALADRQVASIENLIRQNRKMQIHMAKILKDAEDRHRKVVQELEEEKCKHEHDTAQGDDITYGLEKDRTRLKQELDIERLAKKKLEKELKKASELAEEEREKQKQIVLILLEDRKKAIMKYIEERKRSEDLAQILSEEKGRVDSMAEGLEEESKKALQMEAELEKHLAEFDTERQQLKAAVAKEEKRAREAEIELEALKRKYMDGAAGQSATMRPRPGVAPQLVPKPANLTAAGMTSSVVSKVVQPTATVSSVPVCAPTTGIARSVSPGQTLRPADAAQPNQNIPTSPKLSPVTNLMPSTATAPAVSPVAKKVAPVVRGTPPPVPPNKPVIPPKKPTDLDPKTSKVLS
ncbi:CTTNBP2 N-terminal-like protein isoform X1 [Neocloeon triangulifer]|uniref:CTTNBP2 N-terminal-like protein isoform X1 n=1 Tax=Neocloeon triangulifer TaxID=2078957 RepID=UPI00286EF935|nr:CTTNBP2 N-terminal-like protein isoform X1 [Neocloeon triangulifer]